MCGRFTLRTPAKDIAEIFYLINVPDLRPRYNVAPRNLWRLFGRATRTVTENS